MSDKPKMKISELVFHLIAAPFTFSGIALLFIGICIGDGFKTAVAVFWHLQRFND